MSPAFRRRHRRRCHHLIREPLAAGHCRPSWTRVSNNTRPALTATASDPLKDCDDSHHRDAASGEPAATPSTDFATGILLSIVGTSLFSLKSIFIKLAYAAGGEPTLLLALRMGIALPFYLAVLWRLQTRPNAQPIRGPDVVRALGLGFLGYYLASYLDLSGLKYLTAQLERLTLFIYPAIVAVLAWMFLGEGLNRRVILSIVLCYCGVGLMYGHEQSVTTGSHVRWGVSLVTGSAISYSVYILFAKPTMKLMGSRQFTSLAMIGSTFFVGVHFAMTGQIRDLAATPGMVYLYGFVLAIVCTLLPSFMINEAIMRIGATRTAVIGSAGPAVTMLLAIGILGEPTSAGHVAGMAVAMIGVSLVTRK